MQERHGMRSRVARILDERLEAIVGQAVAVSPYARAAGDTLDAGGRARFGTVVLQLLAGAVRHGALDPESAGVADLRRLVQERRIGVRGVCGLVYLVERAALDELAEALRAESVRWGSIEHQVRQASFDLLGAFAERLTQEQAGEGLRDPLTTLYARPVVEAVLEKETHRAARFGHGLALIVFDVDRLAGINAGHGYGFGDRVLERIGIVVRSFFREHDWVARWSEDAFAVLLPETSPRHAEQLAERVRVMIEERLRLQDYRTDEPVSVTVSVGLVVAAAVDERMTAARLVLEAEQAMHRAKETGRNRVETVDVGAMPASA